MNAQPQSAGSGFDVVIIGAGFGGLCMAIQLKKSGINSFILLEKGNRVGGTWRDNTYPGAACDVQSHLYSYSFEPKSNWSRKFAPQAEIQAYVEHCAARYALAPHIRFGQEVVSAVFDAHAAQWLITTRSGEQIRAGALITACGQLNRPAFPDIKGIAEFKGKMFHSARWDHAYDLNGKRVAVIGTGASAIQFVPEIVPKVAQLKLFQRSAAWVISKADRPFRRWEHWLFAHMPLLDRFYRASIYLKNESRALAFTRFHGLLEMFALQARWMAWRQVKDADKRRKLIPNYKIGCKRILISNDWYPAMNQDHVEIVTDAISHVEGDAVVTRDGTRHAVDAIIFGTGFQATDFLAPMRITGLNGRDLNHAWRRGAEAYKGISVSGFPNLFMLYGPNTNLGHNSILYMLESQVHYVMQCVRALRRSGPSYLDVKPERQRDYSAKVQNDLKRSVWASGCSSWYRTASGKIVNNWPSFTFSYRRLTRTLDMRDYYFHRLSDELPTRLNPSVPDRKLARIVFRETARLLLKPSLNPARPVWLQRRCLAAATMIALPPRGCKKSSSTVAGIPVTRIDPEIALAGRKLLYLHGGAYAAGGAATHANLAARIGRAAAASVWLPEYRLAPEHRYPAALDDTLAVYRALLEAGQDPRRLTLIGDSAGGGLALTAAVAIRDAGLPMPAALVFLSPWVDFRLEGRSISSHAACDPVLDPAWLAWAAKAYLGPDAAAHVRCSPLHADLTGLPPMLIHVGAEEILLSDAQRLASRARAARVPVEYRCFDRAWHVFQFHAGMLPEADRSIAEIAAFIHKSIRTPRITPRLVAESAIS
ncbi:MAG TPA: alpha/beta hydrolase fold domain-containing protein [Noviherbaspirillum sp.]|nr:alpha/beta hydrolase fold domain-containing protein [Noviherbaspirillum sp.]